MLLLAPARDYASPATLARLEHEYSLAAELDPRWAARPVALGRHQGRTVLALEDPGGVPLARLLGKPIDPVAFLQLAISLACAVEGVHAAGLIHKDITPAHVLVDSATVLSGSPASGSRRDFAASGSRPSRPRSSRARSRTWPPSRPGG